MHGFGAAALMYRTGRAFLRPHGDGRVIQAGHGACFASSRVSLAQVLEMVRQFARAPATPVVADRVYLNPVSVWAMKLRDAALAWESMEC